MCLSVSACISLTSSHRVVSRTGSSCLARRPRSRSVFALRARNRSVSSKNPLALVLGQGGERYRRDGRVAETEFGVGSDGFGQIGKELVMSFLVGQDQLGQVAKARHGGCLGQLAVLRNQLALVIDVGSEVDDARRTGADWTIGPTG